MSISNPDIQALVDAVAAVRQEVIDLEGKVNSGTALTSGDFAAIKQATADLDALVPAPPAPAPDAPSTGPTSGDTPPSPDVTG